MAQTTNKHFIYRVYKNNVYKGLWKNVISEFAYDQDINSAGSAVVVRLGYAADSFSEGSLVDFNNQVKVYVVDDENPNGLLLFQGFVMNYKPIYGPPEYVEVTLMGYGATLDDFIIETGEAVDVSQPSYDTSVGAGQGSESALTNNFNRIWQSFTVGGSVTKLSAVEMVMAAGDILTNGDTDIFNFSIVLSNHASPSYVGDTIICEVFSSQADAEAAGSPNLVASASLPILTESPQAYKFTFAAPVTVTPGAVYYARLRSPNAYNTPFNQFYVYYHSTAPYSGGQMRRSVPGNTWSAVSGDAYIKTYSSTGSTTSPYSSQDPSAILRSILDNYAAQGGSITYTGSSIDTTNTSVTYQFNANTVLEGVNACLKLAPVGWYWYIDQATNVLHFHQRAQTASKKMVLGKHIVNLSVDKRIQELINIIYFIGGVVGSTNLYQKYTLQTSVDLYGRRALKIVDRNVTSAATAQIIANSYLTDKSQVTLRVDFEIVDNGGQAASILGFNLESLTLGETISFKGFGVGSGGTLWDVALWDVGKWDFDITDLSSVIIQITRLQYSADKVHLSLSTIPPDVTKRIEDVRRNVDQLNSADNPSAPS